MVLGATDFVMDSTEFLSELGFALSVPARWAYYQSTNEGSIREDWNDLSASNNALRNTAKEFFCDNLNIDSSHATVQSWSGATSRSLDVATLAVGGAGLIKQATRRTMTGLKDAGKVIRQATRPSLASIPKSSAGSVSRMTSKEGGRQIDNFRNTNILRYTPPNPLHGTRYSKKVLIQMEHNLKTGQPDFHGFPRIVDNYANFGQKELIKGNDGFNRVKISLDGGYKGLDGYFEWIIEVDKSVNHRLFIPNP